MIERYTLTSSGGLPATSPRYNIAHGLLVPVVAGGTASLMRWGMLRPWRGHGGKRGPMIYAASLDTVDDTPILRAARKKQRCAVLADGFFVWQGKQPRWCHPERRRVIAFAGLWHTNPDDDQPSFVILHDTAPPLVAAFGAESPIVIEDREPWLASGELVHALANGLPGWRADAVSTWVNREDHDDPRCIEPLGNLAQGELF